MHEYIHIHIYVYVCMHTHTHTHTHTQGIDVQAVDAEGKTCLELCNPRIYQSQVCYTCACVCVVCARMQEPRSESARARERIDDVSA